MTQLDFEEWDGVPDYDDKTSWHWIQSKKNPALRMPAIWLSNCRSWNINNDVPVAGPLVAMEWDYVGPCLLIVDGNRVDFYEIVSIEK